MHKSIPIIFAILALIVMSLCSACVTQSSPNETSQQNTGLSQIQRPVESPYVSFEVAQQNLPAYQPDPQNTSYFIKTIYYFTGLDVDRSGNARSWIFGVRHTNGTEMLAYDQSGWIKILWDAPPGSEEIEVDNIVSPAQLFRQNAAIIFINPSNKSSDKRDLELKQGVYTLTITSGSTSRILTFNATTGELIP